MCRKLGAIRFSCFKRGPKWTCVSRTKHQPVFFFPQEEIKSVCQSHRCRPAAFILNGMPLQPRISKSYLKAYSSAYMHRRRIFWMANDNSHHLVGQPGRDQKSWPSQGGAAYALDVWISVHCFDQLGRSYPRKPAIFCLCSSNRNGHVSYQTEGIEFKKEAVCIIFIWNT